MQENVPTIDECQEHLKALELELGPWHAELAKALDSLAYAYQTFVVLSICGKAEFFYRKAFETRMATVGPKHGDVAITAHALGTLLMDLERWYEAEAFLKRAVDIRQESGFPPVLANSLQQYGTVLRKVGKVAEATIVEAQAREIYAKVRLSG